MVPLYAARVQDLGPDDVAVFKCGACGHTAELPPSVLLRGLGLQADRKVLDLERRLRCRLCLRQGAGRGVDQVEGDGRRAQRAAGINVRYSASRKRSRACRVPMPLAINRRPGFPLPEAFNRAILPSKLPGICKCRFNK